MPPKQSDSGNVKVVARIRPSNNLEKKKGGTECVKLISDSELEVSSVEGLFRYTFDRVLGPEHSQEDCFECVASSIIEDVLKGYNATIFAYGQTSSGKTYTMEGPDITDPDLRGIIPRAVSGLFEGVTHADANLEFTVKVAYIEIYMERICDLLDRFRTKVNLSVREDPREGVYVAGVTEEYVTCESELLDVMAAGAMNRATAATGMNEGSSRSHSVFMVTVSQRNLENNSLRSGKLFLVDLAGSEMVRKTQATGQQLEEAKTINKSLSALGLVINALTEDKQSSHIPYRDSKLTRVLQDSLGGNAKTALLINCSPSSYNVNETLSTLRFGTRAKRITNKPKINEQRSVEELNQLLHKAENAIDMQQSYILALEGQLRAIDPSSEGAAASGDEGDSIVLQNRIAALTAELSEEREESTRVSTEVSNLTGILLEKERLLRECGDLLQAAQMHCETQRALSEKLETEKSKAMDDAANATELLNEATTKFAFESQEFKVHLETLEVANEKLRTELDSKEFNSDPAGRGGGISGSNSPSQGSGMTEISSDMALTSAQLSDVANQFGLNEQGVQYLKDREEQWKAWAEDQFRNGSSKVVSELEASRARLSNELQTVAEKNMELEMQLSQLKSSADPETEKVLSTRERNQMRMQKKFESLQQRLEQLVFVHRQLLRKYAALELDVAEDKKKISLRDERIAQLEGNARALASKVRTQSARHVVELNSLNEKVNALRQEQMEARSEHHASLNAGNASSTPGTITGRAIRGGSIGGAGETVRAIRGGGVK